MVAGSSHLALDGTILSLYWGVPFISYLIALAALPVLAPHFWHRHYGKVACIWSSITLICLAWSFGIPVAFHTTLETYLHHFIPFIIFIFTFYAICGGIKIDITSRASPLFNLSYLSCVVLLASWIGTTGAAMLFIRPFLKVNQHRTECRHLVIFYIILVCNIGGTLTPIGDPPLFLGFLNGVDFFWPTVHLLGPFLTAAIPLLLMFYLVDRYYANSNDSVKFKIKIAGKRQSILLGLTILTIISSGMWHSQVSITIYGVHLTLPSILRDSILLILALISLKVSTRAYRVANSFSWAPFQEVFIIFATIFIIAAPMFAMLHAGAQGSFAGLFDILNKNNQPQDLMYFWLTGVLSAFLDNAPTYLVFFNLAGGKASSLMTTYAGTLTAISLGAVFMGALTYIGNAPNFMVKAIAEEHAIKMPSFIGYLAWSLTLLLPLLFLVAWLWI